MKKGLTHLYTGDGKGKTTAAIGLAVRAAGCGYAVRLYQFGKNTPSGELKALSALDRIEVFRADDTSKKFTWDMTEAEKDAWREAQQALFDEACAAACDPAVDLVILDEALGALSEGALTLSELCYLIDHKSKGCELVLTGRDAPAKLIDKADYVTDMRKIRHPYDIGVDARRGIEY